MGHLDKWDSLGATQGVPLIEVRLYCDYRAKKYKFHSDRQSEQWSVEKNSPGWPTELWNINFPSSRPNGGKVQIDFNCIRVPHPNKNIFRTIMCKLRQFLNPLIINSKFLRPTISTFEAQYFHRKLTSQFRRVLPENSEPLRRQICLNPVWLGAGP